MSEAVNDNERDFCYECDRITVWRGEICGGCGREWGCEARYEKEAGL